MLTDWINSNYCKEHGITKDTVAEVVRRALVVQSIVPDGET